MALGCCAVTLTVAVGYRNATASPLVRHINIHVPGYPPLAAPLQIVLFSDLHVHGPDMPPERVRRIVDEINRLHPDIDVAAGDFVGDNGLGRRYGTAEAIAPLKRLRAKFGVYAVLGNHDYMVAPGEIVRALNDAGVRVLVNQASEVGPVALGGIDGRVYSGIEPLEAARRRTFEAMARTPGIKVFVTHRPDEVVTAPNTISLVLAGHTHCGQIVLPLVGALQTGSDFGQKYVCGAIRVGPKLLLVTAGLGTSHLPLRIGAPPDIWVISIRGPVGRASQR